jgi:S1-C subfamily serine protease
MLFRINVFPPLIALLLLSPGSAAAGDLPNTIDKIRGSVVAIGTVTPIPHSAAKRPTAKYQGTGFVVGDGRHVITNYHVIPENLNTQKNEILAIFTGRGKSAQSRRARVVRFDQEHDLALLSFSGTPLPAVTLGGKGKVREGTAVAFTGFPLGTTLGLYPVTHKSIVSAITPVVIPANSSGQLTAKQIKRMRSSYSVYQLDAVAYPGNSGSPVYDIETGEVIGVLNSVFVKGTKEAVLKTPSGISYAIPSRYVQELMRK